MFSSIQSDMDYIFGAHQRQMNNMMGNFFPQQNPIFNGFGGIHHHQPHPIMGINPFLQPFQMPLHINPTNNIINLNHHPNHHQQQPSTMYISSSSSITSISSDNDINGGRPRIFQQTSQLRQSGNMKEIRHQLQDSESGRKKMTIGRHVGQRGYIKEREDNLYTGKSEQREEFINLHDDETDIFNTEWKNISTVQSTTPRSIEYRPAHHLSSTSNNSHQYNNIQQIQQHGGVTIEELPQSDKEDEELKEEKQPNPRKRKSDKKYLKRRRQ